MEIKDYQAMNDQMEAIKLAIDTYVDSREVRKSNAARDYLSHIVMNDRVLLKQVIECGSIEIGRVEELARKLFDEDARIDESMTIYRLCFNRLSEDSVCRYMGNLQRVDLTEDDIDCIESISQDTKTKNCFINNYIFQLKEMAEAGNQRAFDVVNKDNLNNMFSEDWEGYVEFIIKCSLNEVDTKNHLDCILETLETDEDTVRVVTDLGAMDYLKGKLAQINYSTKELCEKTSLTEQKKQQLKDRAEVFKLDIQKAENGELGVDDIIRVASKLSIGNPSEGIYRNATKATKLYHIAAKQGSVEAMYRLGVRMVEGNGCRKNWNAGMQYIRKAANAGHSKASEYIESNDSFMKRLIHKILK